MGKKESSTFFFLLYFSSVALSLHASSSLLESQNYQCVKEGQACNLSKDNCCPGFECKMSQGTYAQPMCFSVSAKDETFSSSNKNQDPMIKIYTEKQ